MIKQLKRLAKRLLRGEPITSEQFEKQLRERGIQIGEHCTFYDPGSLVIDTSYLWLVTIGDNVKVAHGVILLTHDYAWSVLKRYLPAGMGLPGAVLGASGAVTIGNRVFIGMNAIITRGVTIGDDVVIGAGSVVTRDCPSGGVYAGNPARLLMSTGDFYEKRKAKQVEEAKALARAYQKRFGRIPEVEVFHEYFPLFSSWEAAYEVPRFRSQMELEGNGEETRIWMKETVRPYPNFEAFCKDCFETTEER